MDSVGSIACDHCDAEGIHTEAHHYCLECNEYMCERCGNYHKRSRALRHHKVVGKQEMPRRRLFATEDRFCSKHEGESIKVFCATHDVYCCVICMSITHQGCDIRDLTDIANAYPTSQEYNHLTREFKEFTSLLKDTRESLNASASEVKKCYDNLLTDIQVLRLKFNKMLDNMELELKREAQSIRNDDQALLQNDSKTLDSILSHVNKMSVAMRDLEKYQQNQRLVISASKYKAKLKEYHDEFDELARNNKMHVYSLDTSIAMDVLLASKDYIARLSYKHELDDSGTGVTDLEQTLASSGHEMYVSPKLERKPIPKLEMEESGDGTICFTLREPTD